MNKNLRIPGTASKSALILAFACLFGSAAAGPSKTNPDPTPSPVTYTSEILVQMHSGALADALAQKYQLSVKGNLLEHPDWIIFKAHSVADALRIEKLLKSDPLVMMVGNNSIIRHTRYQAFTPNDPYYPFNSPAGFNGQWHLNPNASGRPSVNTQGAWAQGILGNGVIVGIVDDGLQSTHPDLAPNFNAFNSFDFGQNDVDPTPVNVDDNHGTAVAGVVGARGGNSLGVTGAAPRALLAGIRLDFGSSPVSAFGSACLWRSSGIWTDRKIGVKNHSYGIENSFIENSIERNALETSAAAGTVHVMSAGNERADANRKMAQNSPGVICVAALGGNGVFANYSNYGACVFVTAPSSTTGLGGITTTDRTGEDGYNNAAEDAFPDTDYTSTFGGTSSSSPLVAGVLALLKERNPALDVRLAKHLLARTSKVVDPWDTTIQSDGGWKTNGGGFRFNQNYGFGLIHAADLLNAAKPFYNAGPKFVRSFPLTTVNLPIPDNNPAGVETTFFSGATVGGVPLEDITIRIRLTHPWSGDIKVEVTSPYGTRHRLVRDGGGGIDDLDWTFTTNAFWGENPMGTWKIHLADMVNTDIGMLRDYTVTMNHGAPATRLGSNILTYNSANAQQMNAIYNGKSYMNQGLPNKPAGTAPVAIGDVNGDRRNDIMYQDSSTTLTYSTMYGYSGVAIGTLGNVAANQRVIGINDINRNGVQDVVTRNTVTNEVGFRPIQLGGLNPVLGPYTVVGVAPAGTIPFAVADFTGDAQADIALDKTTVARSMVVWQLAPGGTPYGFLFSGYQASGFSLIGVGDFNYDWQPDFVALNTANGSVASYNMNLLTVTTVATLTTIPAGHTAFGAAAL